MFINDYLQKILRLLSKCLHIITIDDRKANAQHKFDGYWRNFAGFFAAAETLYGFIEAEAYFSRHGL